MAAELTVGRIVDLGPSKPDSLRSTITDIARAHTPGPWRADTSNKGRGLSPEYEGYYMAIEGGSGHLPDGFSVTGFGSAADEALIIAAPDLLEALEAIFSASDPEIGGSPGSPLEKARAAIAKARGEA